MVLAVSIAFSGLNPAFFSTSCLSTSLISEELPIIFTGLYLPELLSITCTLIIPLGLFSSKQTCPKLTRTPNFNQKTRIIYWLSILPYFNIANVSKSGDHHVLRDRSDKFINSLFALGG